MCIACVKTLGLRDCFLFWGLLCFYEFSLSSKRPPPSSPFIPSPFLANINVHAHTYKRAHTHAHSHTHIRSSELPVHQHVPVFHKCLEKKNPQADHHSNTLYIFQQYLSNPKRRGCGGDGSWMLRRGRGGGNGDVSVCFCVYVCV